MNRTELDPNAFPTVCTAVNNLTGDSYEIKKICNASLDIAYDGEFREYSVLPVMTLDQICMYLSGICGQNNFSLHFVNSETL